MRADFGFLVAAAAFLASVVTTLAAVKGASYAAWLAMPLVAVLALHLFAALHLQSLLPRAAVGVMLTPAVLSLGAITIANAAGIGAQDSFHKTESNACFESESYAALARLPRRPDRDRHRLRAVPAGADAALGAGGALPPALGRHHDGAPDLLLAARSGA